MLSDFGHAEIVMQRNDSKSRIHEFRFCILSRLAFDRLNTNGLLGNSAYLSGPDRATGIHPGPAEDLRPLAVPELARDIPHRDRA